MKKWLFAFPLVLLMIGLFSSCGKEPRFSEDNPGEITFGYTPEDNIVVSPDTGLTYANNELLVVVRAGFPRARVEQLAQEYDAEIVGCIEATGDYQWQLNGNYSENELNSLIEKVEQNQYVLEVSLNLFFEAETNSAFTPNDTKWKNAWDATKVEGDNWGAEAIQANWAWDESFRDIMGRSPVNVGLIDNCFDEDHEDLQFAQTFLNASHDEVVNAYKNKSDINHVSAGHGTHTAGTMAASFNNNKGIAGIYPFGAGRLYGVSYNGLTQHNNISTTAWKAAFAELIIRNVKVINVSMGYSDQAMVCAAGHSNPAAQEVINSEATIMGNYFGRLLDQGYDFVIVNAAGNDATDTFRADPNSQFGWVADANGTAHPDQAEWGFMLSRITNQQVRDRIIVVGAAGHIINTESFFLVKWYDSVSYYQADFSKRGDRVDIMAPGVLVYSTLPDNAYKSKEGICIHWSLGLEHNPTWDGTSMASPHVAGVAAMVWSFRPKLTGAQVKECIVASGSPSTQAVDGTDKRMVNAPRALSEAAGKKTGPMPQALRNGIAISSVWEESNGGQNYVSDVVVDAYRGKANKPIASVTTDVNGRFELVLTPGNYVLKISKTGYHSQVLQEITIKAGQAHYLDWIKLSQGIDEEDETIPAIDDPDGEPEPNTDTPINRRRLYFYDSTEMIPAYDNACGYEPYLTVISEFLPDNAAMYQYGKGCGKERYYRKYDGLMRKYGYELARGDYAETVMEWVRSMGYEDVPTLTSRLYYKSGTLLGIPYSVVFVIHHKDLDIVEVDLLDFSEYSFLG